MLAEVYRARKLTAKTDQSGQVSEAGSPRELEALPGIEETESDANGMTPLMRAACDGQVGTVQALLDRGAEVNAKRFDGLDALALAAFFGHSQVVWVLLTNGADVDARGRAESSADMWADARAFMDIGDLIREARATKREQAATGTTTLEIQPVTPLVPVEATESRREEERELVTVPSENTERQTVIEPAHRAAKTLPDIIDPPAVAATEFQPGSVFVSRIMSSWKNVVGLILVLLIVCGVIAAFAVPQIRKALAITPGEAFTKTTTLPAEASQVDAAPETSVSGAIETPTSASTEAGTVPTSGAIEQTTAESNHEEATPRVEAAEVDDKTSPGIATARAVESRAHSRPGVSRSFQNNREFFVATTTFRSGSERKQSRVSANAKSKQLAETDQEPKPAPLIVEMGRSVNSTPVKSATEGSLTQTPSLGIISSKPKSKVIQWP